MDLGTAITAGIMILICAIPFILINRSRKRKKRKLLLLVNQLADKSNSTISKFEIWQNSIIGLDPKNNLLFFGKILKDGITEQFQIDLNRIKSCALKSNYRIVNSHEMNQKIIDKIEMSFVSDDLKKPAHKITFFDSNDNFQLSGEVQMSQKWERLISNQLIK